MVYPWLNFKGIIPRGSIESSIKKNINIFKFMSNKSKIFGFSAIMLIALSLVGCDKSSKWEKFFNKAELVPVLTSKEGRWSMINDKGEIVYDSEFKSMPTIAYNGLFTVEEDGYYAVYKADSKKPVQIEAFAKIKSVGAFEDGLIPATAEDSRIAVYDEKGNMKFELMPVSNSEIVACSAVYEEGRLWVKTADSKYGFYDTKGNLVIKADYDFVSGFVEGISLVGKKKDDSSELKYSVIDKNGETLYDLKGEYDHVGLDGGYVYVTRDERVYLYDRKGEDLKLPEKVYKVNEIMGDYIIFTNKEGEKGLANVKGDILINPKFYEMYVNKGGSNPTFIVKKDRGDKEVFIVDKNGEKEGSDIDYELLIPAGKYGYFAKDGNTYLLLNQDMKKKTKEEFYNLNLSGAQTTTVTTDYFSYEAIANVMVEMVGANGVGDYKFDSTAGKVLQDETPSYYYTGTQGTPLSQLSKEGYGYTITVKGLFSQSPAQYAPGTYTYEWNPLSLFKGALIEVHANRDWGQKGHDALVSALKNNGFKKDDKLTTVSDGEGDVYVKGDVVVAVPNATESRTGWIGVASKDYFARTLNDTPEIDSVEVLVDEEDAVATDNSASASSLPAVLPSGGSLNQFSYLWTKRLTAQQVSGYTKAQLRILRNAIYAHHGYIFNSDDLKTYFGKFSDYHPTTKNVTNFSSIESDNVALLKKYE